MVGIFLVEDSLADAELLKTVIENLGFDIEINYFKNGKEVLNYLHRDADYKDLEDEEKQIIMLLDLNMPKVSGLEVLKTLQSDDEYRKIPKIVFTTSQSDGDMLKSYDYGASSYIAKALNFQEMTQKMTTLTEYWFKIARVPTVKIKKKSLDVTK